MDLELQRTCLNGHRLIYHQTVTQEETMEGIVPDSKPDMVRIMDATGQPGLFTKELSEGLLRASGMIRASILYLPEGEIGPRSTEIQIPVHISIEDPAIHSNCKVQIMPRACLADARALNPRKVLVRTELTVEIRIFEPEEINVCAGAKAKSHGECLQQKLEQIRKGQISTLREKNFVFSDVLNLPASRPRAKDLLRTRMEVGKTETKIIGSRLVVKGEAGLTVLYGTEDGQIYTARFSMPFSQILEAGGAGEESDSWTEIVVTGLECTLQPGDPGSVAVNVELLIQTFIQEEIAVTLLSDLYSTNCNLEAERTRWAVERILSCEAKRERVRKICECTIPAKSIVDVSLSIGRTNPGRAGEMTDFRTETKVNVLFLSEDDALCSVTYPIQVTCQMPMPEHYTHLCRCRREEELTAVPVTGGLEVRFELEYEVLLVQQEEISYVNGVLELPSPVQTGQLPSVILRMAGEGETLWEIAKAYHSTTADIAAANRLGEEIAPAGMMLIIPRRR